MNQRASEQARIHVYVCGAGQLDSASDYSGFDAYLRRSSSLVSLRYPSCPEFYEKLERRVSKGGRKEKGRGTAKEKERQRGKKRKRKRNGKGKGTAKGEEKKKEEERRGGGTARERVGFE